MRVHRLVRILTEIDRCGKVKAQNLAEMLEASDRTIYRDAATESISQIKMHFDPETEKGE